MPFVFFLSPFILYDKFKNKAKSDTTIPMDSATAYQCPKGHWYLRRMTGKRQRQRQRQRQEENDNITP
jgi:hypothetical protein